MKNFLRSVLFMSGLFAILAGVTSPAQAACVNCAAVMLANSQTRDKMNEEHNTTNDHIEEEFDIWEKWITDVFVPAFMPPEYLYKMAEQVTVTAVYQVFAIGTLFDAKQELEVQRIFQKRTAEAQRDYQPSVGICSIGTTVRSLAAAERRAETTTFVLSQRSQDRQLGNMHSAAAGGGANDKKNRMEQFRRRYCDTHDNNDTFMKVCVTGNGGRATTLNKDIDYNRTVDSHRTMDIDFTDSALTDDEEDVMTLASNLYSHEIFNRIEEAAYNDSDPESTADRLRFLLEQRQIVAKRSVAENSFNTIVGLKSLGSPGEDPPDPAATVGDSVDTARYLRVILEQLGMSDDDIKIFMRVRPSYFAQMEMVTKKVFQQPGFYADLYDKPANVDRKKVALQAIGLMQDFDTWQSYLRTESILSVLLEMEIIKYQGKLENSVGGGENR